MNDEDEIRQHTAQAAEIERLREALRGAVEYATAICRSEGMKPGQPCDFYSDDGLNIVRIAVFDVKAARAALGGQP